MKPTKPRPYTGYARIDRACGWAAATVLALAIIACVAGLIITLQRDNSEPQQSDNRAATELQPSIDTLADEAARPLLPVEYIVLADVTEPEPEARIVLTDAERDLIAAVVWLEARGEPADGQQAVVEVVLNRVAIAGFPDTVEDVIRQTEPTLQFSVLPHIDSALPTAAQYDAIDAALYSTPILPHNVVYFSAEAQNSRVWGVIGNHIFCEI